MFELLRFSQFILTSTEFSTDSSSILRNQIPFRGKTYSVWCLFIFFPVTALRAMILYNQILIQTSMSKLQGTSPCVMGPFVYAKRMITDIDAKIKFPGFRSSAVLRKDYPSPFGEFSPLF